MTTAPLSHDAPLTTRRSYAPLEAALLGRTEAEVRARDAIEAARRLVPLLLGYRREMDHTATIPPALLRELREAGMLSLSIPTSLGGLGLWQGQAYVPHFQILEILATGDSSIAQCIHSHNGAVYNVISQGSLTLRERIAREVLQDGKLLCSVGSEAPLNRAGPATYESELERVEGGWILDGEMNFSTFAPVADYLLAWRLVPGPQSVADRMVIALVPRDAPGVELVDDWDTLGQRATMSWTIRYHRVFIPDDMMVGRPGWWKNDAPRVSFLLGPASNFVGTAQRALTFTCEYVARRAYLRTSQVVRVKLGEMSTRLAGARCALYAAARQWEDEGIDPDDAELNSMRAWHLAREAALYVTTTCMDVAGGRSIYKLYPIEGALRDVRTFTLQSRDEAFMEEVAKPLLGEPFNRHAEVDIAIERG
jgi:alkylation response protein AidB-like acyl-CoA dehydrogenase